MNKHANTFLVWALAIALIFSVALGTSALAEDTVNLQKISDTGVTWTAFKGSHTVIGNQINDWSQTEVAQLVAKKTGITLSFITPLLGQEATQLSLLVSSQTLPDFVFSPDTLYTGGALAMLDDGLTVDLAPYLDQMPNFKASLEASDYRKKEVYTDDGRITGLPTFFDNDEETEVFVGILIRKDLLDKVGMDVPVTYDDWYNVLTAFKNECGITKAFSCGPQMWGQNNMWSSGYGFGYMDYFGTQIPFYQIDGQVRYAPLDDTASFKAYLEMMAKWYAEGLIDPDFQSVTDVNTQIATYSNPECGACITAYSLGPVLTSIAKASTPDFEYVCAPIPVLEEGQTTHLYYETSHMRKNTLVITKNCQDLDLALQYWDQFYGEEMSRLNCWGIEGDTFTYDANGDEQWTDKIIADPSYNFLSMRYSTIGSPQPGNYDIRSEEVEAFSSAANDLYRSNGDNAYRIPSSVSLSEDERDSYNIIMTDVNTFVEQTCMEFMMGTRSFDTFDQFIEDIRGMNVQEAVDAYQSALDRYNAR
jgi:putative aldouronate transport system substrate-binding protein